MYQLRTAVIALATLFVLGGCTSSPGDQSTLDAGVEQLMKREKVHGLGLAIIEEGQVVHVAAHGRRNAAKDLPLTTDTIMYGASFAKPAFAYTVLQLVDEGRLDLDKSVADLLPRPLPEYEAFVDLAADERWRALTPRILLTHTSGLANFRRREPDGKLRFHFDPGSRYGYSSEGFHILQLVVEQGLGLDAGSEMQTRVFDRFGMTNTSMTWREDFANNLADGYDVDGVMVAHHEWSEVAVDGSMDTSIADQARMWAGIMRGDGLAPASRAEMVRAHVPITSAHLFPTLATETDPQNAAIGLAAGLGVVVFRDTSGPAWFKGGHTPSTGNMVVCFEEGKRCVVMLANDVRAERIYPELARMILGETQMPWRWEYSFID